LVEFVKELFLYELGIIVKLIGGKVCYDVDHLSVIENDVINGEFDLKVDSRLGV
jgi:hypothetical protein